LIAALTKYAIAKFSSSSIEQQQQQQQQQHERKDEVFARLRNSSKKSRKQKTNLNFIDYIDFSL
jgi:hypothetical protein